MFSGNKKTEADNLMNTTIGEGIIFEGGVVKGTGGVRVDGEVNGLIDIQGNLTVGETGHIKGDIKAKEATVSGKVDGDINCSELLHLTETAIVNGNITVANLVVDEGSKFTGNCKTTSEETKPVQNLPQNTQKKNSGTSEGKPAVQL
ncbi:hypothetical protein AGMMS49975_11650 [Clostridia bacterium]|nr:hypothetical protein AGMMS49975_11650 [Clostridia bacterium]